MLVHGFVYEVGEATAISPHSVLGVIRILMVALVAVGAVAAVAALARSAGLAQDRSLLGTYPLILAAALVASSATGALVQFPHTLIGSVALMFAIVVATGRDRDLQCRELRWHEYVSMAATGVLAATFYDLAYLTPLIAAAFVGARAFAGGLTLRALLATATVRRWLAHAVGFAAVLVPIRIVIALGCADGSCYAGSDLSLSPTAFSATLGRLWTGLAPFGWDRAAGLARSAGVDIGVADLGRNAFMALIVAGVAASVLAAARQQSRSAGSASSSIGEHVQRREKAASRRLAGALLILGVPTAVLSALTGGLTVWVQDRQLAIGQAWRETLLTQIAWSMIAAACVVAFGDVLLRRVSRRMLRTVIASVLGLAMIGTLVANWRYAEYSRRDPAAMLTGLVALSSIYVADTENANAVRCGLVSAYGEATADQPAWKAGEAIGENLDELWLKRYGFLYCDPVSAGSPDDR